MSTDLKRALRAGCADTSESVTNDKPCGHRNVTGTFDELGCHLRNRCNDCGYTVEWAT